MIELFKKDSLTIVKIKNALESVNWDTEKVLSMLLEGNTTFINSEEN